MISPRKIAENMQKEIRTVALGQINESS